MIMIVYHTICSIMYQAMVHTQNHHVCPGPKPTQFNTHHTRNSMWKEDNTQPIRETTSTSTNNTICKQTKLWVGQGR